jgi:hypothetical protein
MITATGRTGDHGIIAQRVALGGSKRNEHGCSHTRVGPGVGLGPSELGYRRDRETVWHAM